MNNETHQYTFICVWCYQTNKLCVILFQNGMHVSVYMERFNLPLHHDLLTNPNITLPKKDSHSNLFNFQVSKTKTSDIFFSSRNIDILQAEIVKKILELTQRRINRQSDEELIMVMRSIYLQYAVNLDNNYLEEVRILNAKVLDYCIPNIVSNLSQYIHYLNEVGKVPIPLQHAEYMSTSGMRGYIESTNSTLR